MIAEASDPRPGNGAVMARLAESLFVEVLRWQFRYASGDRSGWMAGLQDRQIGRVINLIHALPERAFRRLVGSPPATWRQAGASDAGRIDR